MQEGKLYSPIDRLLIEHSGVNHWKIAQCGEVDSTMREVWRFVEAEGIARPDRVAAIAEAQTAGTGRFQRAWHSPQTDGLWMTVLFHPSVPMEQAPLFTLMSAVAVTDALLNLGFPVGIKWPNDVLASDNAGPWARRKLCGIRAELFDAGSDEYFVSLGIGLNINNDDFPEHLRTKAVCLKSLNDGVPVDIEAVTASVLEALDRREAQICRGEFPLIRDTWMKRAIGLGEPVEVDDRGEKLQGIALGIDDEGHLLLKEEGRSVARVVIGDLLFPGAGCPSKVHL